MPNLLPCPFCGMTKNRGLCFNNINNKHWAVSCSKCTTSGPMHLSKEKAIAAWNRRTQTTTETSCGKTTTGKEK